MLVALLDIDPLETQVKVSGLGRQSGARCVTVICKTNRQKLEQIIRYPAPAGASYNTFTRKQMTNLQLTTGQSRSQSAHHHHHRRVLKTDPVNSEDAEYYDWFYGSNSMFSGASNAEFVSLQVRG